jgi:hypothetical protein
MESREGDVLVTAHSAVDLLLVQLGHAPPPRRLIGNPALTHAAASARRQE